MQQALAKSNNERDELQSQLAPSPSKAGKLAAAASPGEEALGQQIEQMKAVLQQLT